MVWCGLSRGKNLRALVQHASVCTFNTSPCMPAARAYDGTGRDKTARHDKTIELRLTHREVLPLSLSFDLSLSSSPSLSF